MSLLPSTQSIVERLEALSQRPVHITEDASISNLADIKLARGDMPFHLLRYKPTGSTPPDYLIAYQCGLALRVFETPPEKRFDLGSSEVGQKKLGDMLLDPKFPAVVRTMTDRLLHGLITQLRSYPVGLRVDAWLHESYPDLRELQTRGIRAQLDENIQALKAGTSGYYPTRLSRGNLSMNAAFALHWARLWNEPPLTLAYKAAGLLEHGESLMKIFHTIPPDAANDRQLIDEWGFELRIKDWYQFVPHPTAG